MKKAMLIGAILLFLCTPRLFAQSAKPDVSGRQILVTVWVSPGKDSFKYFHFIDISVLKNEKTIECNVTSQGNIIYRVGFWYQAEQDLIRFYAGQLLEDQTAHRNANTMVESEFFASESLNTKLFGSRLQHYQINLQTILFSDAMQVGVWLKRTAEPMVCSEASS